MTPRPSLRVLFGALAVIGCTVVVPHKPGNRAARQTASRTFRASGSTSTARRSRRRTRSRRARGRRRCRHRTGAGIRRSHAQGQRTAAFDGRRSAGRPHAGDEVGRGQARLRPRAHSGRAEHETPWVQMHHARASRRDVSCRLQQRLPDHPDSGLRVGRRRDDPRDAHHPDRRPAAAERTNPAVEWRAARPLGRQHAGGREHQLQQQGFDRDQCGHRPHARHSAD